MPFKIPAGGQTVSLAAGATVGLEAGSSVGLAAGSAVDILSLPPSSFYWSCVTGELNPPTLGTSVSYATWVGMPVLAAGGAGEATWPIVPLYSPGNLPRTHIRCWVNPGTAIVDIGFGTAAHGLAFQVGLTFTAIVGSSPFPSPTSFPTGSGWRYCEFIIDRTAMTTTLRSGGLSSVRTLSAANLTHTNVGSLAFGIGASGGGYISSLTVAYT